MGVSKTPGTEAGPVTAAGRALYDWLDRMRVRQFAGVPDPVLVMRIEAEARAQRDAELRAALHDAIDQCDEVGWDDSRTTDLRPAAVHAAIDAVLSDHARADTPSRQGREGT